MIDQNAFPNLRPGNHQVTSPPSPHYNCVAWANGDSEHWWQPGEFWPLPVPRETANVATVVDAFRSLGFSEVDFAAPVTGERIVIFGDADFFTHVARQLPNGRWTSKLGHEEDIEHDQPEDVGGGVYGAIACFMQRPKAGFGESTGLIES